MQQILIDRDPRRFAEEVNALLMDGWTVVVGTMTVDGVRAVAGPQCPSQWRLQDGSTFERWFSVVLENHGVR